MAKKPKPRTRKRRNPVAIENHVPPLHAVPHHSKGRLIVIGGNENKDGHKPILEEVAGRVGRGKLVVATFASDEPKAQWEEYRDLFKSLGVRRIAHLDARTREELIANPQLDVAEGATVLFFAGGDQLKITSRFGGTPLCEVVRQLYAQGATIAGTSSGASVMSETMLIAGSGQQSHTNGGGLRMAPGLGLIPGVVIDQHFAERGRIGRLLGAVARNPRLLGIGIDEDTAIAFDGHMDFRVLGSGAVYVADGRNLTYTDVAEDSESTSSIHGVLLHVLAREDRFDLNDRTPQKPTAARLKQMKEEQQEHEGEADAERGANGEDARP
jgi:cyanophycinase